MIEINSILEVEKYISEMDVVIFDLDDTLYSEKEYVKSGYIAAVPDKADELWRAFLAGKPAFDTVVPEKKDEALAKYRAHKPNIYLYPGVKDMIQRIRLSGKKIGIITDGRPEGQRNKISALKLIDLVDKIIVTDELGGLEYRKPNTKSFEIMKSEFNVPYEKMIYIGDNLKKDFIAPNELGMNSIWFNNMDGIY